MTMLKYTCTNFNTISRQFKVTKLPLGRCSGSYTQSHRNLATRSLKCLNLTAQFRSQNGAALWRPSGGRSLSSQNINTAVDTLSVSGTTPGFLPPPPDAVTLTEQLSSLGEPTLSSLGLCGWWPAGWVQGLLESIHVFGDMPWYSSIILFTVIIRCATLPLTIIQLRSGAQMNNHMPTLMKMNNQLIEARRVADIGRLTFLQSEITDYQKRNNCNPLKMVLRPLIAAPVFISVFYGIREMASLPVQSLITGGGWWFPDLTAADPFYALPAISAITVLAVIKSGAEGTSTAHMPPTLRRMLNCMPIVVFAFSSFQPAALALYWSTSNIISLVFACVFRTEYMRKAFNIPDMIQHPPQDTTPQKSSNSFSQYTRLTQMIHEMEERKKVGALKFKRDAPSAESEKRSKPPMITIHPKHPKTNDQTNPSTDKSKD